MWARTISWQQYSWHAIRSVEGGSVATYCHGRWETSEPYETEKCPARGDQCRACNLEMANEQPEPGGCTCRAGVVACAFHVERELGEATQPIELFEFVMPDDRFDDGGAA